MKLIVAIVLVFGAVASGAEIWEGKKYKQYESENFNEYMKEIGVGWFLRSVANSATPTASLTKLPDNKYKFLVESTFKNSEIVFELGKEFDEVTLDGRKVKSVVTFEDNIMTHKQGGSPPVTIVRKFGEKELIVTLRANDVVSTIKYRAE